MPNPTPPISQADGREVDAVSVIDGASWAISSPAMRVVTASTSCSPSSVSEEDSLLTEVGEVLFAPFCKIHFIASRSVGNFLKIVRFCPFCVFVNGHMSALRVNVGKESSVAHRVQV